ncbi:hypothetical protein [Sulfurimonas sp. CS5]|jgi:hypothetical protein|uniref:hypothetical protein n=1 Tax=Sulfurimonas sp. CS5 TaxID=3391145 RepID=UPI0039EBDA5F
MNKTLKKMIISAVLLSSPLAAELNNYSLIGIETGYSSLDYEQTDSGVITDDGSINLTHVGLKVGTEIKNYRVFLSTRVFEAKEFDFARTYGMEFQYLFNFSKYSDMFIGVNAGTINMEYNDKRNDKKITLDNIYFGGDIGFNVRLSEVFDFEVGARIMSFNSSQRDNTRKYDFDNIVTAYASIILKFQMN